MAMSKAMEAVTVARIGLLLKHPFFGQLAMRLQLIECDEELAKTMTTAAVDGRRMWFNPAFIETLSKDQVMFLVGHEVMHCVWNHLVRRHDRDPKLYNMAADYVINASLVESKMKMPEVGLYDEKYLNWTTEDVYDDLKKNNAQEQPTLDVHPGDPGHPGDDAVGGNGPTESEQRELEDEWKDAVIQAAQASGAGNVPSALKRLIEDLTEPKMDWKQMLQMHLQACVRSDYTWMKPNKRTFGLGITMPSMDLDDEVKICIAIDTSGSVSHDMLKDFLSEVKGIMDAFSSYEIHIACFDTQVHQYACITNDDEFETYELGGGGGTDFMCWWNWAQEQEWITDVKKCLFFTDGYPYGQWGIEDLVDTLWIVHGSTNEGPFGTTVIYDDHLDN